MRARAKKVMIVWASILSEWEFLSGDYLGFDEMRWFACAGLCKDLMSVDSR